MISGKVYKIINDIDDLVYVGSTAQKTLAMRMTQHRTNAKDETNTSKVYTHMRLIGISHFTIVLIIKLNFEDRNQLYTREFEEMDKFDKKKLLNVNTVKGRLSKEHTQKSAKSGRENTNFKFGCVYKSKAVIKRANGTTYMKESWIFSYRDANFKDKRAGFSCTKLGEEKAREMADAKRKEIYPDYNAE